MYWPYFERYQEHSFSRRFQDYSFPWWNLRYRPFVPWDIRSRERMFHGTFVPKDESAWEYSFPGRFGTWKLLILLSKKKLLSKIANYVLRIESWAVES